MFDPLLCATSPIPVGVEILSRKTYLQETWSRRVAQLEHNINDDKNLWSGVVEGSKWIGCVCILLVDRCDTTGDAHRQRP